MLRIFLAATLAVSAYGTNSSSPGIDYEPVLNALWAQTDADGSGYLNVAEFENAAKRLGLTVCKPGSASAPCSLDLHDNVPALFNSLDVDPPYGKLSKHELVDAIRLYPTYEKPLIAAFTNGAGEAPKEVSEVMPTEEMTKAGATVKKVLTVSGPPSSIYPGTRMEIRKFFATACKVNVSMVVLSFVCAVDSNACYTSERRRSLMQAVPHRMLAESSTVITATIFVPTEEAALEAVAALPEDTAAMSQVPAFDGLTVQTVEPTEPSLVIPPLAWDRVAITAVALLVVLPILLCIIACLYSGRNSAKLPAEPKGCCSNGCCSFNAVGVWAFGQFLAAAALLVTMFLLYAELELLSDAIMMVVDTFNQIAASNMEPVKDFIAQVPMQVITMLRENGDLLVNLRIAIVIPGCVAGFLLLLSFFFPLLPVNKGSYCVTKTIILFLKLVLLIALIEYIIIAAFAIGLTYAPPQYQEAINGIRAACITVPAKTEQLIVDNKAAIYQLDAAGQNTTEMKLALADAEELQVLVGTGCFYINEFFNEIFVVSVPAILAAIAILYAFFSNQALCCAAGCCGGPPTTAAAPKGKAAPQMTGVGDAKEVDVTVRP